MLEADERLLRTLARECKDAKEKMRLLALHAISIGDSISHTSEIFCVDEETVRKWIHKWEEEKSLKDKPRDGRPPSLDENEKKKSRNLLRKTIPRNTV